MLGAAPVTMRRRRLGRRPARHRGDVIILGIILLILGFVFSIPILWTIGLILIVVGVILWILGATGHALAGRRYWY
jgi:hypothetical protein